MDKLRIPYPQRIVLFVVIFLFVASTTATAAVIFGNTGLFGGYRWDAAPRFFEGSERSLDGGVRYSLQGGSYEAYRDLFSWQSGQPALSDFQQAVDGAFNAWTVLDPVSRLNTNVYFRADLETQVVGTGFGGVNPAGAEIDLLASEDATTWNAGDSGQRGEAFFRAVGGGVTLTSGVFDQNSGAISGADITLNNNPETRYSLDFFQLLLTHEIGHALGLGDVDLDPGVFIDDNYDGSTRATALDTLTNSWAGLVDPFDPSNSPLSLFNVLNADPGVDTPGVDILMESFLPSALIGDPTPLQNDDFGGRQFLYPYVSSSLPIPEPSSLVLLAAGLFVLLLFREKKKRERAE